MTAKDSLLKRLIQLVDEANKPPGNQRHTKTSTTVLELRAILIITWYLQL